jgi:transcriptional regulator with XRE-family HTH domain
LPASHIRRGGVRLLRRVGEIRRAHLIPWECSEDACEVHINDGTRRFSRSARRKRASNLAAHPHSCVAFWRLPAPVLLSARRLDFPCFEGDSLGARLARRRHELGLRLVDAAKRLGADAKTVMWWERNHPPFVRAYPAIIAFLGEEPWPEPQMLGEALLAERRRRGIEMREARRLVGVDDGTWRRWERGEWKPTRRTADALSAFLRCDVRAVFPADVR